MSSGLFCICRWKAATQGVALPRVQCGSVCLSRPAPSARTPLHPHVPRHLQEIPAMTPADPHSTSLLRGRVLAFSAILLAALNLRTAVTSITPLLDQLG